MVMGLFPSTARENNFAFPLPVQTRDELLRRYSHCLAIGPKGISDEQQRWLEAVFNTFCSQLESTKYWSEYNLKDFMQSSLPTEITPFLIDAIPILHRTLLRMGSFPYQNNPEKLLVLDVLRTACILFSSEPEDLAGNSYLLVIMFQSMAGLGPDKAQEDRRPRDEDDDYHLKEALWMVRNRARDPNNPRVMISGPENPPPSHFPSSWSKNFDQSIPTGDFRSFLRLMTFLNLYHSRADFSNLSAWRFQVEKVTDCMLAVFQPSATGITWNNFSQAIENHMPTLLRGIYQLLGPFASIKPLPQEGSLSADEMRAILQKASIRSPQREIPSSANILSPPILSQLDIILPHYILPQNISISWSGRGDQLDLNKLRHQIPIQTPSILLVSGRDENQDVIFGLVEHKGSEDETIKPFIVQLAPLHRVFHPLSGIAECSILLDQAGGSPTLIGQLISSEYENASALPDQLESQQCIARLVVCGNSGHFTLSNDASIDEHFHVNAIELLKNDLVEDCWYSDGNGHT